MKNDEEVIEARSLVEAVRDARIEGQWSPAGLKLLDAMEAIGKRIEGKPRGVVMQRIADLEQRTAELLMWKVNAVEREKMLVNQMALISGMVTGMLSRMDESEKAGELWIKTLELHAELEKQS